MANNDLVGSVVKAMVLMKLTATSSDGLTVSELAQAANLKTVTCFNLVRTLIAGGFLEKINGRLYIGSEISRLSGTRFQTDFYRHAEYALLKLNRTWPRSTVIFAVPGKSGMEQTHRIGFDHPGVIQRLNNEMLPPYASAAGLLGLAFIQDEDVRMRIEENYPFSEFGICLWKSRRKLDLFLEKCRTEQYAVSPFDTDVFHRVSVAVFDRFGKFIAVIGASCPTRDFSRNDLETIQHDLKESAAAFRQSTTKGRREC